jgi:hypothetical protein
MSEDDYKQVLLLREQMNRGGKRRDTDGENPQRLYAELTD